MNCAFCLDSSLFEFASVSVDRMTGQDWPPAIYFRCQSCQSLLLEPCPTAKEIADAYAKDYYAYAPPCLSALATHIHRFAGQQFLGRPIAFLSASIARKRDFLILASYRRNWKLSRAPRLLDFGGGAGMDALALEALGFDSVLTDFSEKALSIAKASGVPTIDLKQISHQSPFDVIRLNQVIEHLSEPRETLRVLRDLLADSESIILVSTPNANSLLASIFRSKWWSLEVPRHIRIASPTGLELAAQYAGLEKKNLRYYLSPSALFESCKFWLFERPGGGIRYSFSSGRLLFAPLSVVVSVVLRLISRSDGFTMVLRRLRKA